MDINKKCRGLLKIGSIDREYIVYAPTVIYAQKLITSKLRTDELKQVSYFACVLED